MIIAAKLLGSIFVFLAFVAMWIAVADMGGEEELPLSIFVGIIMLIGFVFMEMLLWGLL